MSKVLYFQHDLPLSTEYLLFSYTKSILINKIFFFNRTLIIRKPTISYQTKFLAYIDNYNRTLKDNASIRSQKPISVKFLYHNLTVTSSSRVVSTSQQEASSSKDMPSRVMETAEMLLNKASVSRSSGSLVKNWAAVMKSMSLSSSWYRWRIPVSFKESISYVHLARE